MAAHPPSDRPEPSVHVQENAARTTHSVREALRAVIDPEIGLDIVTLGLVYDVRVEDGRARVEYTVTTAGCPLQGLIHHAVTDAVEAVPGVTESDIQLVWDPPWTPDLVEDGAWDR